MSSRWRSVEVLVEVRREGCHLKCHPLVTLPSINPLTGYFLKFWKIPFTSPGELKSHNDGGALKPFSREGEELKGAITVHKGGGEGGNPDIP
ncbi:hypothetical protein TNCV_3012461 [Trichonephila clavipes]|nr:hypothetical protein TNCV_3012461 [Trichonephila clavipes]